MFFNFLLRTSARVRLRAPHSCRGVIGALPPCVCSVRAKVLNYDVQTRAVELNVHTLAHVYPVRHLATVYYG